MDMVQGVVLVLVLVWGREVASVLALALAMAMELVVSVVGRPVEANVGVQVVARPVDSSFWSESNGSRQGVRRVDSSFSSESNDSHH